MLEKEIKTILEQKDNFEREIARLKDRQRVIVEKATLSVMDGKVDLSTEEGKKWMVEGKNLYAKIAGYIGGLEFKIRVSEKVLEITDGKGKLNPGKYFELIMSDIRNKKKVEEVLKKGGF